jgi:hypothetical protein
MPAARPACETKVSESSSGIDKAISIVQNRSYLEERERSDVELTDAELLIVVEAQLTQCNRHRN